MTILQLKEEIENLSYELITSEDELKNYRLLPDIKLGEKGEIIVLPPTEEEQKEFQWEIHKKYEYIEKIKKEIEVQKLRLKKVIEMAG